jgi:microcystin-dependent protein
MSTGSATATVSGLNTSFNNYQPSLALTPLIAAQGIYPSQGGGSGYSSFIGQVQYFAGNFAPGGWMVANGQLLPISQYQALFSIIGTTYGGNGTTTFALPNLVGNVAVGASNNDPLGTSFGQANTTLLQNNNYQPSLALNYLIATSGLFPTQGGGAGFDQSIPTLGEITAFSGNFVPSGWALANGQLLSIQQNQALFAILGTTYGGDGIHTFALPDLTGRTLIGADNVSYFVGGQYGTAQFNVPVPEPETWIMMLSGLAALGLIASLRNRNYLTA